MENTEGIELFLSSFNLNHMKKNKDQFGAQRKEFEKTSETYLSYDKPICVRLDGKAFHSWTKGLKRPYDENLISIMVDTMNYLVSESNATLGYCQSDEISLYFIRKNEKEEMYFNGKVQKLTSVLASMATAFFNKEVANRLPHKSNSLALFDCRAWNVPDMEEVYNVIQWRHHDCIKNAVSMAASHYYSHKELNQVNTKEKIQLLKQKGIVFLEYPDNFRTGTFSNKTSVSVPIPEEFKHFKSNEGKDVMIRHIINNFYIEKGQDYKEALSHIIAND